MRVALLLLSLAERRKLRLSLSKERDKVTYVRLLSVYQVGCGHKPSVVAAQLQVSSRAVYKWLRLFLKDRNPQSLVPPTRSGRPRGFTFLTQKRILSALHKDPAALGYGAGAWTVATLATYLNYQYKTSVSAYTLRRRMRELGLRYKRPRYVYEEKATSLAQKKGLLCES